MDKSYQRSEVLLNAAQAKNKDGKITLTPVALDFSANVFKLPDVTFRLDEIDVYRLNGTSQCVELHLNNGEVIAVDQSEGTIEKLLSRV